jgi:homoserine acetyltransferase
MTAAIESDPVYRETKGDYYDRPRLEQPLMGNLFGWSLVRQSAFVDEYRVEQSLEQYSMEAFSWEKSKEVFETAGEAGWGRSLHSVSLMDSNDLIYRNVAQSMHDVEEELHRIKAETLIIHVETDQWLPLHLAKRAQSRIEGSKLLTFPHDMGHYAVFSAPGRYKEEIKKFLG